MNALKNIGVGLLVVIVIVWAIVGIGRFMYVADDPEKNSEGWWELLWGAPWVVVVLAIFVLFLWAIGEKIRGIE